MRIRQARPGFTLIEIMVVIAIIAILVGLVSVAVISLMRKGPEATVASEIRELEVAIASFKTKFHVYPPSRIRLRPLASMYNPADPFDVESLAYINQLWPRIGDPSGAFSTTGISWNGVDMNPVELEADQCLVFFLAGPGANGFSTNPYNPADSGGDRVGPFFTFPSNRLVDGVKQMDSSGATVQFRAPTGFPSFVDYWQHELWPNDGTTKGAPYIYFSSGKKANGYNSSGTVNHATLGVSPYYEVLGTKYLNPNTCQIISAGQDGQFGTNFQWRPASADKDAPIPAADNQVNFSPNLLGVK